MEQLQQTQYVGSPHSENRQASRMIVLAGTNFYDYDLKAFGKDRILFGRDSDRCDIVIPMSTISGVHGKIKFANGKPMLVMWEVPMERIYTVVKFMNG